MRFPQQSDLQKEVTMKPVFKSLVLASLMASAGFAAYAQTAPAAPAGTPPAHTREGGRHHRMDPAKMEQMMAKRSAELKAKLKITTAQEGAWTAFTTAMKPPARDMKQRPDRAELAKLTTPERIDKMRALRTQHTTDMNAAMNKRDEATKTFYASLDAEQKKVFDAEHARMGARHGRDGGAKHGHPDGKPAQPAKL
jgi:protein CpxP